MAQFLGWTGKVQSDDMELFFLFFLLAGNVLSLFLMARHISSGIYDLSISLNIGAIFFLCYMIFLELAK